MVTKWIRRRPNQNLGGSSNDFYSDLDSPSPIVRKKHSRKTKFYQSRKQQPMKRRPITDFLKILSLDSNTSTTRRTYGETMNIKIRKLRKAEDPRLLLENIFESLTRRLFEYPRFKGLDGNNYKKIETIFPKGTPKYISFQICNKYMTSPFYVPLRNPIHNNPKALTAELLRLARQSGGKFKILKTTNQLKIYAVWQLKRKDSKWSSPPVYRRNRIRRKNIDHLHGSCSKRSKWFTIKQITPKRRGIVQINNDDSICMARAVALGIILHLFGKKEMEKALADPKGKQQFLAHELLQKAGIPINLKSYGLKHVAKLQKFLRRNFRIIVFHAESGFKLVYRGKNAPRTINLLLHGQHFDLIDSTQKLLKSRGTFCPDCEQFAYSNSHYKHCVAACRLCYNFGYSAPCKSIRGQSPILCKKCHFFFPNKECFARHALKGKRGGSSICEQRFFCSKCKKVVYKRGKAHRCLRNENFGKYPFPCEKCNVMRTWAEQHHCYIQPLWWKKLAKEKDNLNVRYIFFDVETTQQKEVNINGTKCKEHKPNLIVCETLCVPCIDGKNTTIPNGTNSILPVQKPPNCLCGVFGKKFAKSRVDPNNPRLHHFHSFDQPDNDPAEQFLDFLLNTGSYSTTTIVLSHNGGKFDIHLVLMAIYNRNLVPKMTMTGLKIYRAEIGGSNQRKIIFKDTLNFIQGALARLFDMFELDGTGIERKPAFPHLFNKQKNIGRILPHLPALKYYCLEKMKPEERAEFLKHYQANKEQQFDLRKILISYCVNDCQLLREGCLHFRRIILQLAPRVDPFFDTSTIAKLAFTIWRQHYLKPNLIVNFPEEGLRGPCVQSNEARRFFCLFTKLTGKQLQTIDSVEGEHVSVKNDFDSAFTKQEAYSVDALLLSSDPKMSPTIIEYNGCASHGCPFCFPNRKKILQRNLTAEDLFAASERRKIELKKRGYNIIVVWQCKWREILKKNKKLKEHWNSIDLPPPPMNPRVHGLKGGRVEPFRLFSKAADDEVIELFDVVSLYPSVMKNESFPLGLPIVYGQMDMHRLNLPKFPWSGKQIARELPLKGFLLVRILPPKRMPILSTKAVQILPPFLPYRTTDGRLVFPLCRQCSELKQTKKCHHNENERSWWDAIMDADLRLALKLNYQILEVHEVWHWPSEQWTDGTENKDLFKNYINALLKIKVEASGWPANVETEDEKDAFIDQYFEREGITLDRNSIKYNKGLREIMKLLLNSLWGKLCQRPNPTTVGITKCAEEFHELLANKKFEIVDVLHLNQHLDRVAYRRRPEFIEAPNTNNVMIAGCVTAHGRRRLYRTIMEAINIGNELLYGDTDSVLVKRKIDQKGISEGQFLGDMTRELPDRRIRMFVTAGPKNYAYLHTNLNGDDPKIIRKIRGFELTYKAGQKLKFNSIVRQVIKGFHHSQGRRTSPKGIPVKYVTFQRNKFGHIFTKQTTKMYKAVFKKGIIKNLVDPILPYGYCEDEGVYQ